MLKSIYQSAGKDGVGIRTAIKFWFASMGILPLDYVGMNEKLFERGFKFYWVSSWRTMSRHEVHLVNGSTTLN